MTVFEYNFTIKKGSKGYIIEGVLKEAYMYICTDSTANATQDKNAFMLFLGSLDIQQTE